MAKEPEKIYKRKVIDEILKYLDEPEAVILYGSRQVGKTFVLYWLRDYLDQNKAQIIYLDLERKEYLQLLEQGPNSLKKLALEQGLDLERKVFFLIDEIQYLKDPSNFLKLAVDHYRQFKIIASGSSTFEIRQKIGKALVGRALTFEIFGLDFEEFLMFQGYQKPIDMVLTKVKENELRELFQQFIIFGSYPKISLLEGKEKKERYLWQIIDTYLKKDIRDLAEVKEIEKFNKLLEILASQTGQLVNVDELSHTCHLAKQTVQRYLFILENTYVIRLVKPFFKNLRSELFKTPKIYFYDSGLAHLLWLKVISPEVLGEIFETVVFSELAKKFGKGAVNFWRSKDKKEIDFILRSKNKIIPIEAKINFASFSMRALDYFLEHYKLKEYYCVGFKGERKKDNFLFPWEINKI